MQDRVETGPNLMIRCSRGASDDLCNVYCTTNSTTYKNHMASNGSKTRTPINSKTSVTTGYTKNCSSFVEYDRAVDEKDYPFTKEQFITTNAQSFFVPPKPTPKGDSHSAGTLSISAFSRNYKRNPQQNNHAHQESEMKGRYKFVDVLKSHKSMDLSRIIPSTSGFVSDAGHFTSLGNITDKITETILSDKTQPQNVPTSRAKFPVSIKDDGFTRSTRPFDFIFDQDRFIVHADTKKKLSEPASAPQKIVIGRKQATGSVINNHAFVGFSSTTYDDRFQTESSTAFKYYDQDAKFGNGSFSRGTKCNLVSDSGFTSSNRSGNMVRNSERREDCNTLRLYHERKDKHENVQSPTKTVIAPSKLAASLLSL